MFCPRCGAEGQAKNAYCKRCGEWLPELKPRVRPEWGGGDEPRMNLRIMMILNGLSVVCALFSAIALYAGDKGQIGTHWSVKMVAAFCLTMAGWQLSSFLIALRLRNRLRRARERSAEAGAWSGAAAAAGAVAAAGETQQPLPGGVRRDALGAAEASPVFGARSVAEPTTELLKPLRRREEERDESR